MKVLSMNILLIHIVYIENKTTQEKTLFMSFTTDGSKMTQVIMKNAAFSPPIRKFLNGTLQISSLCVQ
jgi:hypothetical protein